MNLMEPIDEKYGIDYWYDQFHKVAIEAKTYGVKSVWGLTAPSMDDIDAESLNFGYVGGMATAIGLSVLLDDYLRGQVDDEVEEDAE